MFDIASDCLKGALDRKERLDNKAVNIITFVGIITTLFSGIGILGVSVLTQGVWLRGLYGLGILFFLGSILFGLWAYKTSEWDILDAKLLVDKYHGSRFKKLQIQTIKNTAEIASLSEAGNEKKANKIEKAWYFVTGGMVIMLIFTLIVLAH